MSKIELKYQDYFDSSIQACSPSTAWKEVFKHVLFYKEGEPYCIDWKAPYWKLVKQRYHSYLSSNLCHDPRIGCGEFYRAFGSKSQQTTGRAFEVVTKRLLCLGLKSLKCVPGNRILNYPEYRHLAKFKDDAVPFDLRLIFSEVQPDLLLTRNESIIAVVSSKWTLRTDRAENARTEARNLKQLCNGRVPYIALATNENDPARLVAVARGYDLSRIYHCNLALLRKIYQPGEKDYVGPSAKTFQRTDKHKLRLIENLIAADRLRDFGQVFDDLNNL